MRSGGYRTRHWASEEDITFATMAVRRGEIRALIYAPGGPRRALGQVKANDASGPKFEAAVAHQQHLWHAASQVTRIPYT